MSGKWITDQQKRLYMKRRSQGNTQEAAAAKADFSIRSAKRVEKNGHCKSKKSVSEKANSRDPFKEVWENDLVPLLEKSPNLQAVSLLYHLQDLYPGEYPDSVLRTLQRRVRNWKGVYGPEKEIIFRQNHPPGWQGLTDFTCCNKLEVTINNKEFSHLLYHFWLAFSTWEYAFVITGGESYTALAEGLQGALWALGGVPQTHRTDSLQLIKIFQKGHKKTLRKLTRSFACIIPWKAPGITRE